MRFTAADDGGFAFDTGGLKGKLRRGGKSLGLQEVVHRATGNRIDRGNGLLGHYRVFTTGKRYGAGAWDWPSAARLREDGAVEVAFASDADRPFELGAVYRWVDSATVEVETTVKALKEVLGFEALVASYFHEAFSNAVAYVRSEGNVQPVRAQREGGDWQVFPRDEAAVALVRDGRWQLEPHPVAWEVRPPFVHPLARRRAPLSGLSGILMAPVEECFAVSMPHETEAHYSLYFSLFGRDLSAGETARARVRLVVAVAKSDAGVLASNDAARKEWEAGGTVGR